MKIIRKIHLQYCTVLKISLHVSGPAEFKPALFKGQITRSSDPGVNSTAKTEYA